MNQIIFSLVLSCFGVSAFANIIDDCAGTAGTAYSFCLNEHDDLTCRQPAEQAFAACLGVAPGQGCNDTPREECDSPIPQGPATEIEVGNGRCYKQTVVDQSCRYFDRCGRVSTYHKTNLVKTNEYVCSDPGRECNADAQCGRPGSKFCNISKGVCEHCNWHQFEFMRTDDKYISPSCSCEGDPAVIGDQLMRNTIAKYRNSCTGEEAVGYNFEGDYCSTKRGGSQFRCWYISAFPYNVVDIPSHRFMRN